MSGPPVSRPIAVAQVVTTLARGGAQATVVASSGSEMTGAEVTLLAGPDVTVEGTYWDSDALADVVAVLVPDLVRKLSPARDLRALFWMIRWLRTNRPDVVHTHSSKAGVLGRLAARLVGIPCAHTVHGWGPLRSRSAAVRLVARSIERSLALACDAIVVVGGPDLEFGLENRIGRPARYRVIRSGVDLTAAATARRDRDSIRRQLDVEDRYVIGMVARMSELKDHVSLVHAFAAAGLTDATLVLVGDGPCRASIASLVESLGITDRVLLLGVRADAARLVAAFDLSVLSSRLEGMPRTVVEAAAAEVPIIATDVGSVGELIIDGVSGRLIPAGDVDRLTEAIIEANRDRGTATAMARRAAELATEFSADRMRADLLTLWADLVEIGPVVGRVHAGRSDPEPSKSASIGAVGKATIEKPGPRRAAR